MPGLVPGIHVVVLTAKLVCLTPPFVQGRQSELVLDDVDGRDKPGHDAESVEPFFAD